MQPFTSGQTQERSIAQMRSQIADLTLSLERVQESSDLYRFIADSAADAILAIDRDNQIIYANPSTQTLLGYRPFDLMGKPLTLLIPEEYQQAHRIAFQNYLSTQSPTINWAGIELEVIHKDGTRIPVEIAFGVLNGRDGEVRFTGFFRDIRERKHNEVVARQQFAQMAHTHRVNTVGAFGSALAHELNQPLSAVCLHADLISELIQKSEVQLSEDMLTSTQEIVAQAQRAASIIKLIRNMIRQETPVKQLFPVSRILTTVSNLVSYRARQSNIVLQFDTPPEDWNLFAEERQIEQLLLNLLNNAFDAVEHSKSIGKRVQVLVSTTDEQRISISVVDYGSGITEELRDKLFESFVSTKANGVGIGLSICRSIAEAHEGTLVAQSNQPQGAKFILTLPLHKVQKASEIDGGIQ